MQVLIIPAWLRRKLDANNLPLTVVLDIKRLSSILTTEDLFFILKANHDETQDPFNLDYPMLLKDVTDYTLIEDLLLTFGPNQLEMLDAELQQESNTGNRAHLIYGDVLGHDDMDNNKTHVSIHSYDTVMLQPEVIAVLVNSTADTIPSNNESLKNFLDVLQKQIGFEKVAMLKSFKHFIKKV
tara:strand:- start:363 stop:911 length:549 start_codon:yes stop_codon:yes gene_type:complete